MWYDYEDGGKGMKFVTVAEIARNWGMSERGVRNYCTKGKIQGAFLKGKTWKIPENTVKPEKKHKRLTQSSDLLAVLKEEKQSKRHGGIYHKIMVDLTFNSNHMEGSKLTHDQTRYIYETNTIGPGETPLNVDDIVETVNHFRCIELMIDRANFTLNETFIKQLHALLKSGTSDSRKDWFALGEYKKLPNEVGGRETSLPEQVTKEMHSLLYSYNAIQNKSLDDIIDFHVRFEIIHPFQDGNGRVGRLIMFKECLRCGIVPFIISDSMKMFYYRGLSEWHRERGFLRDTCLAAQDSFKQVLDYFRIPY
jgi:Fic family protein